MGQDSQPCLLPPKFSAILLACHTPVTLGHACVLDAKLLRSCLTLCDPMDYSLPGSAVHGILQARILEWVATLFYRGSSRPRD